MKKIFLIILAFFLTAQAVTVVSAQTPQPKPVTDDQVNAVAKQLYCPVCENIPLDVCPTQACAEWRDLIRTKLADGWSQDQIKAYFAQQYGDRVLAEPPTRGLNWIFPILPWLAILAGVVILYLVFRTWRRAAHSEAVPDNPTGATNPSAPANPVDNQSKDPYVARLEEELKKR